MKNLAEIHRRKGQRFHWVGVALLLALAALAWMFAADQACRQASAGRVYRSLAAVPARDVGVVLGTSKETRHGQANLHFNQRIAAAAALYRAGKVRHLLVSGDNHIASYDEPEDMRAALIAAGVPASAITCDYAGFRTLDSVVRAQAVFGLSRCTLISEAFHCPRALWIARQHGLEAIAFAAPDVGLRSWSLRASAREQLARSWCAVDLYLLHRGPKFLGKPEPILVGDRALACRGEGGPIQVGVQASACRAEGSPGCIVKALHCVGVQPFDCARAVARAGIDCRELSLQSKCSQGA